MSPLNRAEVVPGLPAGVLGWTTTRACGSFGFHPDGTADTDVAARWDQLDEALRLHGIGRLASAHQVHGADVLVHASPWEGRVRFPEGDGHITTVPGTALAVTIADCTPVLIWHEAGAVAALHAGWRGTAAGILNRGLDLMDALGFPPSECHVHLGPAICGRCYEVGPEVLTAVHGVPAVEKGFLDVRAVLATQAARRGVGRCTIDPACTRCDRDRFFSHRGGDLGRQLGIIALQSARHSS